jgi:tetratricopeptide (TPR) repeat protein
MDGIEDVIDAGWKARREGHHGEAERSLLEVIEITRRTGAKPQLIRALKALAHVVRDVGQDERALPLYEEAVTLSREEGDIGLLAHTVRHLGDVQMDAGRLAEADLCYREALSLYRSAASPPALDFANALRPAALLKERQGDRALARELWTEAKDLYEAVGVKRGVDECARHLTLL